MEIYIIPILLGVLLGVSAMSLILFIVWGLAVSTARHHMKDDDIEK